MIRETFEVEMDGREYKVALNYERVCLRRGTYSSAALDPDEYYGMYKPVAIEVEYAIVKFPDLDDPEDWLWVDVEDVYPEMFDDVTEDAIEQLKDKF